MSKVNAIQMEDPIVKVNPMPISYTYFILTVIIPMRAIPITYRTY